MRVLVVHAHPDPSSYSHAVRDAALKGLAVARHEVDVIDLYAEGFRAAMSREERLAYESGSPILDPQVEAHVALVRRADALVFVYPTWWWGLPAVLKGWLERVLVPGVAFVLDERTNTVRPGLGHVRRLVGITTYGSSRPYMRFFNDAGRRVLTRCVRLLMPRSGRRVRWLGLYGMDGSTAQQRAAFLARVERELAAL